MRISLSSKWLVIVLSLVLVGPVAGVRGDEESKSSSDAKAKEDKPKVTKLSGVFESLSASEIKADTEHLSGLEIKRVLPHGTKVTKGQNVVWFETEDIDKQIKSAEIDFRLSKLTLQEDNFGYQQFLKTQALDKAAAELSRKQAQQAFDNFVQVDRERQIKSAMQNLKSSQASLDNSMEELKQLEQMYKEDDLTEESEEIVLKRAKQSVEYAEFRLEGSKISTQRTLKQSIPRMELQQKATLERAQMAYQKSIHDLEVARQRRDLEMGRKKIKFAEEEKKLKELQAERKKVVLQAPGAGLVFHGKLTRGKLSDKPSSVKDGAKVTADQVIATVVDADRLQVRIDLAEKDLLVAKVGAKCVIVPTAFADTKINAKVKSVSKVPYVGGKYDCVVSFRKSKDQPAILPSMGCSVQFEQAGDAKKDLPKDAPKKEAKKNAKKKDDK